MAETKPSIEGLEDKLQKIEQEDEEPENRKDKLEHYPEYPTSVQQKFQKNRMEKTMWKKIKEKKSN